MGELSPAPHYDENYYSKQRPDRFSEEATTKEVGFVAGALGLPEGSRVLDIGSGNGRHTAELAGQYKMVGLDYSEPLLQASRQMVPESVGLVRGDMRKLPLPDDSFDGAVSMFSSWGFFDDNENQMAVSEAARVLRPGGVYVIDYGNGAAAKKRFENEGHFDEGTGVWTLEEPRENLNRVTTWDTQTNQFGWQYKTHEGELLDSPMHQTMYSPDEIESMLSKAGLEVSGTWGDYDAGQFDDSSPRIILRAVKPVHPAES